MGEKKFLSIMKVVKTAQILLDMVMLRLKGDFQRVEKVLLMTEFV